MRENVKLLEETKKLMISRYPRFAQEIAKTNLKFDKNLPYHTAATDGKNIYFDPDYLESLNAEEKTFLIAHEMMHIKFEHMFRMKDKNGQMRDSNVWNIATDAIINANLERDGFKIKEGCVNIPDALNYSAEEMYEKLLKEKQNKDKNNDQQKDDDGQGKKEDKTVDDHSLWGKASEKNKDKKEKKKQQDEQSNRKESDEKFEFEQNRQERKQIARQKFEEMKRQTFENPKADISKLNGVGESKPILDWRLLLRREIDKTETIWSQRRSIAENNYAYRIEENDIEDNAETEVMIDVSGSVPESMVRAFLRQLKPILRESKLKVGFFASLATSEFQEIKRNEDVDKITVYRLGFSTNYDAAVKAFSVKKDVNKIIFTDGGGGNLPSQENKNLNVIWLVYENENFMPNCGKVIFTPRSNFQELLDDEDERDL